MKQKRIVLDTNILLRAVFGTKVRSILNRYEGEVVYCFPELCVGEANKHLEAIALRRGFSPEESRIVLNRIVKEVLMVVDASGYSAFEQPARARIGRRDPADWPVVATALLLDAPIWTEDRDFFGTGIATWTTDRIEIFLEN